MSGYHVRWSGRSIRELDKLNPQTARAIVRFMNERVEGTQNPRALGHPLRGEGLWRYRVGDYRVLCQIQDQVLVVLVVEVGHRREVYR
jgi:mRNA interferase RelE/StbE